MTVTIQPNSHTPIYQQIVQQVTARVLGGTLASGECLPSVRRLADQLLVNPNTVARAYRELEREGVVVTRPGSGVYIADQTSLFRARHRRKLISDSVDRLLDEAEQVGLSPRELQTLIGERADKKEGRKRA